MPRLTKKQKKAEIKTWRALYDGTCLICLRKINADRDLVTRNPQNGNVIHYSCHPDWDSIDQVLGGVMKCPTDGAKISSKHYDPDFEWYECPKCGGCFTADELEETENGTSPRKRRTEAARSSGAGSSRSNGRGNSRGKGNRKPVPVAKGKKRLTEIQEDEEAVAKHEAEMLKPKESKDVQASKHKDDVPTKQIVNIMADEIQAIYEEMGGELDTLNAQDKALTIWREARTQTGISAREQDVEHVHCAVHS